jgi:hypothetical protein
MTEPSGLKLALKRGALVALGNWPLALVQFVAESVFKIVLAVPVVGGMLLVTLIAGDAIGPLAPMDLRERVAIIAGSLLEAPAALASFVVAFGLALMGGSALLFLVKGGVVAVMAESEAAAGPIERVPLRWDAVARAARWTIEGFLDGCSRLFPRYMRLGLVLIAVYTASGSAYAALMLVGFSASTHPAVLLVWALFAAVVSGALLVWITIVNFLYLLTQVIIAVEDVGVREAMQRVVGFLRGAFREVTGIFGILLLLGVLAIAASLLATAGLGLISFVPFAGLAVIPLQIAAWLIRGLVFQYLSLTALGAYLSEYRAFTGRATKLRIA